MYRGATLEAQQWEEFAKQLSLKNAVLQQTLGDRNQFCSWLADEVLRAQGDKAAMAEELDRRETELREENDCLRAENTKAVDAWTATDTTCKKLAAAHYQLKVQYLAVVNAERESSKRVRELQKLTDDNRYVRKSAASARKKIKQSSNDELFFEK